jgi:hypothetical protein
MYQVYQVGQEYFSVRANLIITVTKTHRDYVDVKENRDNRPYRVSHSDMGRFIASGRLRPLNDFTPIKYLYKQPKIWQCDKDCVSL